MKNSDKPINPIVNSFGRVIEDGDISITEWSYLGLSKREHFAGLFIQGILSAQTEMRASGAQNNHFGGAVEGIVSEALEITDELLKQLENEQH